MTQWFTVIKSQERLEEVSQEPNAHLLIVMAYMKLINRQHKMRYYRYTIIFQTHMKLNLSLPELWKVTRANI